MNTPGASPLAARLATGIVSVFFLCMAWIPLLNGGVSIHGKSGVVRYVAGNAAYGLSTLWLLASALTLLLFVRSFAPKPWVYVAAVAAMLLAPVLYIAL